MMPGCSQMTVHFPGMQLHSARSALNAWRDCWAVSVPTQQLILDSVRYRAGRGGFSLCDPTVTQAQGQLFAVPLRPL